MAAFPVLPAPACTSFSPSSVFLTPCSSDGRSTAPRAAAVRGSAVTWAHRTLSARWVPSGLAVARPAARKARLEELDTSNMLLRQRIVFLGSSLKPRLSLQVSSVAANGYSSHCFSAAEQANLETFFDRHVSYES